MRAVIIEDEPFACEKLERYLLKYDTNIEILNKLDSVKEAVNWINLNQASVDLFFMDIQLIDGLSFEIFDQVNIIKPVIFTTAFDEFAIDAFKVNGIDYLLKPVLFTDLTKALKKLETLKSAFSGENTLNKIVTNIKQSTFKNRFLVSLGNHIHSIKSEDITLFFAEGRDVYLIANNHKKYMIDYKLEDLCNLLDPKMFFRVNRSFIVNINSIKGVLVYSNRRLKLTLKPATGNEIIVSREKVADFKRWLEGG